MGILFCDLKTDEEKAAFFLSGRGYETGVISQAIQNDVAMAYHRCVEYKKELEALQSQDNAHKHPHPQRNDCHCVRCKPLERPCGCSDCLQSQDREYVPFLQEDDQHDLHRFIETTEDGQGYDIGKERIKRLTELGVVSNQGFGRYSVTMFGYWCHEKYWHQNPSLPLKTVDEYNAEQAIDHARRIEGETK